MTILGHKSASMSMISIRINLGILRLREREPPPAVRFELGAAECSRWYIVPFSEHCWGGPTGERRRGNTPATGAVMQAFYFWTLVSHHVSTAATNLLFAAVMSDCSPSDKAA
jgi:hypothetical protein